jgi:TetR/AcrR family transcriptional repressor of nem operon
MEVVPVARTPEFDRDTVLTSAMGAFWEHGYEATSLSDLLEATGLSKSSLYAGFGGKHDVFLASYDCYRGHQAQHLRSILAAHRSPDGIRAFFEEIIAGGPNPQQQFGCMSTNQAAERGAQDDAVRARVNEDFQLLEDAFAEHLRDGQATGSVPATVDGRAAASALVTAFSGFQLTVRAGLDRTRLHHALDFLLGPLSTPAG